MKFMHLGDLHLGKSLGDFSLKLDQEYILQKLLDIIDAERIDGVLIAGDVYDKSIPSEDATRLLDSFLSGLAERNVNVYMISGNHDSDERLNYGSRLFADNNIFIESKYSGVLACRSTNDDFGPVNIYMLPFVKASQVRHFHPKEDIPDYDSAVRTILRHTDIDASQRNIIIAHQFVIGKTGEKPSLSGSEGAGTISVGLVEQIGCDCFDAFDYVALGHIHGPQQVGREYVRYAGSPLKYSLSEVYNEKSVPVITMGTKGDIKIELKPLKPMRNLRHLKGKMQTLLNASNVASDAEKQDFIYATLTDEDVINDAMSIFQQYYPNTVKIDYDNSHTREIEQVDITSIAQNRSFGELIGDFYKLIYGTDISEEEMEYMREAAMEAGVINEAD